MAKQQTKTMMVALPSVEVEVPQEPSLPRFGLTPDEAAVAIGVSRATIYKLIKKGLLTPSRVFSSVRLTPEELQRFMREAQVPHAS